VGRYLLDLMKETKVEIDAREATFNGHRTIVGLIEKYGPDNLIDPKTLGEVKAAIVSLGSLDLGSVIIALETGYRLAKTELENVRLPEQDSIAENDDG
jgi:hypothetical protein